MIVPSSESFTCPFQFNQVDREWQHRGAGTGPADPAVAGPIFLKRSVNYVGVSITDKIRPN